MPDPFTPPEAVDDYDMRQDRQPPSPRLLAWLRLPHILRARAAVRLAIAEQDRIEGDSLAEWRNRLVAGRMIERAETSR